jgi:hypothetical protein
VLYVLNSLLIFSVALGVNQVGVGAATEHGKRVSAPVEQSNVPKTGAYFSNWFDGTVPRRQQLLLTVEHLNDAEAQYVLERIGSKPEELSRPRMSLAARTAYARTADQLQNIEAAVEDAKATASIRRKPGG